MKRAAGNACEHAFGRAPRPCPCGSQCTAGALVLSIAYPSSVLRMRLPISPVSAKYNRYFAANLEGMLEV